jgi:quercetin 2,3-dioxygenase
MRYPAAVAGGTGVNGFPMRYTLRPAAARGHARRGWLDSRHTFSFADYFDPAHVGFRSLRVINEDRVAPGGGFPMHPHRDMEIFSYVVAGELEHKDSMGNGRRLAPGRIQLMSAGRGVTHSEFNPSPDHLLHFLQVWIHPDRPGLEPAYSEWHPPAGADAAAKVLMISPDGRDGSAVIRQDAEVWRLRPGPGELLPHELRAGRGLWVQMIAGTASAGGRQMAAGDGMAVEGEGEFELSSAAGAEAILFDLG